MTRKGSTENYLPKTDAAQAAEQEGKRALRDYFASARGKQAEVSRKTSIFPPILCNMANRPGYPIGLESAILIEVATEGVLKAEVLCPARAGLLADLLALRAGEAVEA